MRYPILVLVVVASFGCSNSAPPYARQVPEGVPAGTVRFLLSNPTGVPLYAVVSWVNGVVRELDVLATTEAVSPYTTTLCDGDGTHDDPSFDVRQLSPGGRVDYVWGGRTGGAAEVIPDSARNCDHIRYVAPGPRTVRACLFESAPKNPNGLLDDAPRRCRDAQFEVPASGEVTVELTFGP